MRLGVNERKPAWHVMLLATTASGTTCDAAWLAAMILSPVFSESGEPLPTVMIALIALTMWDSSTP